MSAPFKAKKLISEVAEKLNKDPHLVQDVVDFYYSHVWSMMQTMEHVRINIPHLGTFEVSRKKVEEMIRQTNCENKSADSFKNLEKYLITLDRHERSKKLLELLNIDEEERNAKYESLGKPKKNFRRFEKYSVKK